MREAGINVCCGGIVGMGEGADDRAGMIAALASSAGASGKRADQHAGAGRGHAAHGPRQARSAGVRAQPSRWRASRMPKSVVRLSAGREDMSEETQALCFLAGANSIFYGPKLLTTPNPGRDRDMALLDKLGLAADGALFTVASAPAPRAVSCPAHGEGTCVAMRSRASWGRFFQSRVRQPSWIAGSSPRDDSGVRCGAGAKPQSRTSNSQTRPGKFEAPPMTGFLIVFVGGGLGAALRHGVNLVSARWFGTSFPGTRCSRTSRARW